MIGNFSFQDVITKWKAWRPDIALMLSGKWFVYWGNLNLFSWSPFCWSIFLSIPSFARKTIVHIYLFFDFVKTHMSNDCIGWFSTLKHILKGHAIMWSKLGDFYLVFLKLSCVMWMLESLEFGLWSCIMEHALVFLDLLCPIFVFCLIWRRLQIGTWGGVVGQDAKYEPPTSSFVRHPL